MSISPSMVAAQWRNLPIVPKDCTGQTFIVSGSNTGIGLEAAKHFVRLGAARVIIAVRSASKGEAAKDTIESTTGRTGVVEVWPLDLASNDSIRAFAKRASTELDRIDAVLENAGVAFAEFTQAEGTETTIQVNVIGTFLLAILLLPALKASAERWSITPHLTIVSSGAHCSAQFAEAMHDDIFAALSQASTSNMADRYAPHAPNSVETDFPQVRAQQAARGLRRAPARPPRARLPHRRRRQPALARPVQHRPDPQRRPAPARAHPPAAPLPRPLRRDGQPHPAARRRRRAREPRPVLRGLRGPRVKPTCSCRFCASLTDVRADTRPRRSSGRTRAGACRSASGTGSSRGWRRSSRAA